MGEVSFETAKEQIKDRTDLVQLVSESVPLKRTGRSYKGLCPFHDEKTPSFHVFPESQHFKCFGCSKGGDVFTWVMERESLGFVEAMRFLAERSGVDMPEARPHEREARQQVQTMQSILQVVQDFYARALLAPQGKEALDYVERRALGEAIQSFGLGYAPGSEDSGPPNALARHLREQRVSSSAAIELGLLYRTQSGGFVDRFRNRLMFPIHDERNRVVGFGGRILPGHEAEKEPKYLNSPESEVFNKRKLLYGLPQARRAKVKKLVVMEGYTDVVASHLAGFPGAVATLGTSLTGQHASLLRRFSPDGVHLLFDGDTAGRNAAERAFAVLAPELVPAQICLLPDGFDPADLLQKEGPESFKRELAKGEDALRVYLRLLGERFPLDNPEGQAKAAGACRDLLGGVTDPLRRRTLGEALSRGLMLPAELLKPRRVRTRAPDAGDRRVESPPRKEERHPFDKARDMILAAILKLPELIAEYDERKHLMPELPSLAWQKRLIDPLREQVLRTGDLPARERLLSQWITLASGDSAATAYILSLEDLAETLEDPRQALLDGVGFIERKVAERGIAELRERLRRAWQDGDDSAARALELELSQRLRQPRRRPATGNGAAS